MTISAIIPAAGCGTRAGLGRNKVLCLVHNRPLLWWTLRALSHPQALPASMMLREIVVAARVEEWSAIEEVFAQLRPQSIAQSTLTLRCIEGGQSRQESVHNAARSAVGDWLLVHDAARPLVEPALTRRVLESARTNGAAIAALPVSDTVKLSASEESAAQSTLAPASTAVPAIEATLDRRRVWLAQTPQVFRRETLVRAFEQAARDGFEGTDCASLVERLHSANGAPSVALVEGSARNFKVTYADDLERAAMLLSEES